MTTTIYPDQKIYDKAMKKTRNKKYPLDAALKCIEKERKKQERRKKVKELLKLK